MNTLLEKLQLAFPNATCLVDDSSGRTYCVQVRHSTQFILDVYPTQASAHMIINGAIFFYSKVAYSSEDDVLCMAYKTLSEYSDHLRHQFQFIASGIDKLQPSKYQPSPVKTLTLQEATETKPRWQKHWAQPIQLSGDAEDYDEREDIREYVASLGEKELARMESEVDAEKRDWLIKRGFPA